MSQGRKELTLGSFEELVLRAIIKCRNNAYGNPIRKKLEEATGRTVTVGALYATLDRLKEKGFISYRVAEGGEEREGRPKRYYTVENAGRQALIEAEHARHSLVPNLKAALA
jgi:PadR family transcriptional regulator, regulatory protein PadR